MMIPMTIFYSWQVATAQPGADIPLPRPHCFLTLTILWPFRLQPSYTVLTSLPKSN